MFLLNSRNSVTKIFVTTVIGFEPATSCVRGQDDTTVLARHVWETGSLNWPEFMLHWLTNSVSFRKNSYVQLKNVSSHTSLNTCCINNLFKLNNAQYTNYKGGICFYLPRWIFDLVSLSLHLFVIFSAHEVPSGPRPSFRWSGLSQERLYWYLDLHALVCKVP